MQILKIVRIRLKHANNQLDFKFLFLVIYFLLIFICTILASYPVKLCILCLCLLNIL